MSVRLCCMVRALHSQQGLVPLAGNNSYTSDQCVRHSGIATDHLSKQNIAANGNTSSMKKVVWVLAIAWVHLLSLLGLLPRRSLVRGRGKNRTQLLLASHAHFLPRPGSSLVYLATRN